MDLSKINIGDQSNKSSCQESSVSSKSVDIEGDSYCDEDQSLQESYSKSNISSPNADSRII